MRTTIDLDPRVHRLAKVIAAREKVSLGKVVGDAFMQVYAPTPPDKVVLGISEAGFPTISIGRPVTLKEVQDFLDEE